MTREAVQIVEIKQPYCTRTFGTSPCTATGTNDEKCYNTRATCLDANNFDLGSLSLFFSNGDAAAREVSGATYILPFLVSVSTVPTKINLAGSDPDAAGLGTRALYTIVLSDSHHTDARVDPYAGGRSWDTLTDDLGTFWTRWIARNPYRANIEIVVYEGYSGQALSEMTQRTCFMESLQGPSGGHVTIRAKDILARAEERKAQVPAASPGLLYAAISDSATTFTAAGAVEADYDASGHVRIGDEIIGYSSRALGANGVDFSGLTRGDYNTTAASHGVDASIQKCKTYVDQRADDIVEDLLTTYAGIDASWLDTANWATEFDNYSAFYILSTIITEPTSVTSLISELCEQVGFYIWWDERAALVKWKAIRGVDDVPPLLTDETHILADSFVRQEYPRERISQVWIYYSRENHIKDLDDASAYAEQYVPANLEAETSALYGEPQIRKIFGRWLPTAALAQNTASKILIRYVETPTKCTFSMDAKDRTYWVGDTVRISHTLDRLSNGTRRIRRWTIVAAEEAEPGHRVQYTAEDTTLYGEISYIMADGAADYDPAGNNPDKSFFIGDDNGLLSDGTPCARIA